MNSLKNIEPIKDNIINTQEIKNNIKNTQQINNDIINKIDELNHKFERLNINNSKKNNYYIQGYLGAFVTLFIFFIVSTFFHNLFNINSISYYWLCFTVLTGIWEYTYITKRQHISYNSNDLIKKKQHVWFNRYPLKMILPHNTSIIFYSEYAAYADREYMSNKDDWSIVIEGSHCILCGIFSLFALYFNFMNNHKNFYISMSIGMGTQLMNSILYMSEYIIQSKNPSNINYNNSNFPCGNFFIKRPFMYINIFWTLMPSYILTYYLFLN